MSNEPSPAQNGALSEASLDTLFRQARSYRFYQDRPVDEATLRELYDLMKWGPTANNGNPGRIVFVTSNEGRAKLLPAVNEGNIPKVESAPVTAIIAHDTRFFEAWERFTASDYTRGLREDPQRAETVALRNSSLQGAYFMVAARALGLDVGPLSGFNNAKVDEAFFAGTPLKSNFLCLLGYGDADKVGPRGDRYRFEEVCTIV